jgi:hypothetical protein
LLTLQKIETLYNAWLVTHFLSIFELLF